MLSTDYWPQSSAWILVVSRDPSSKSMLTRRPSGLDIGLLSQKHSLFLFSHLTTISNAPGVDTARQISDALTGIPLVISTGDRGITCARRWNTYSAWAAERWQCKFLPSAPDWLNDFLICLGDMINYALDIRSVDPDVYKSEIACATFLKCDLLGVMGKMQDASNTYEVACCLRREITNEDLETLMKEQFDEIVDFWARQ
ncbi:hypothetical protein N7453_001046 [Penicillium expansum]|nr:hypothetical protein N7453_001046 [Penicillium expansum]